MSTDIDIKELEKRLIETGLPKEVCSNMARLCNGAIKALDQHAKNGALLEGVFAAGVCHLVFSLASQDPDSNHAKAMMGTAFAKYDQPCEIPRSKREVDEAIDKLRKAFVSRLSSLYIKDDPKTRDATLKTQLSEFYGFVQGALWCYGLETDDAQTRARHIIEKVHYDITFMTQKPGNN